MTTQKGAQRRQRRRISGEIEDRIAVLAQREPRWSAGQIYEQLLLEYDENKLKSPPPSKRTVERIVKEWRGVDLTGPWNLYTAAPEDVPLVLPVLAAVINWTQGAITSLTNGEARIIANIRSVAPDFGLVDSFLWARLYRRRIENNEPTDDFDAYLSYAPWRDENRRALYRKAVEQGWVREVPRAFILHHENGEITTTNVF